MSGNGVTQIQRQTVIQHVLYWGLELDDIPALSVRRCCMLACSPRLPGTVFQEYQQSHRRSRTSYRYPAYGRLLNIMPRSKTYMYTLPCFRASCLSARRLNYPPPPLPRTVPLLAGNSLLIYGDFDAVLRPSSTSSCPVQFDLSPNLCSSLTSCFLFPARTLGVPPSTFIRRSQGATR